MQSPLSGVLVEFYAGAASRVGYDGTAFAQRRAEYNVGMMAQRADPTGNETRIARAREMAKALEPYPSASLLNFLNEDNPDVIRTAFGDNYLRLVDLKAKYDPTNFGSLNQNVAKRGGPWLRGAMSEESGTADEGRWRRAKCRVLGVMHQVSENLAARFRLQRLVAQRSPGFSETTE